MRLVSLATAAVLALLSARRALLVGAALLPGRSVPEGDQQPSVVLLVPGNDEAGILGRLLATIERLDWPHDRLHVMLVDDGSVDGTWELMQQWAAAREHAQALRLERRSGKSRALNAAFAAAPPADVVVVCDADLRLAPDYLHRLIPAFADRETAAAAGFITSANADSGIVARYSALETWVHQLVTGAGKDRLGLNPATFAGSAYRRSALEAVGGFSHDLAGDDVEASAALTRAGWRTRFVRGARADHLLADCVADYWHQRLRWARNVLEAGRPSWAAGASGLHGRRLELALAALGYSDRVAFAAAVALAVKRRMHAAVPTSYACLRAVETVVAVMKAGEGRKLPSYLGSVALLLPLDVAASVVASTAALRSPGPAVWRRSRRGRASAAFE